MTTNSNFRVKNGLEVAEQAVIDGITLSNNDGTLAAQIITAESISTVTNDGTVSLIIDIGSSGVVDAMNSYNSSTPGVSGSPTYSTDQTKFDDYSWNNEDTTNNYIEAFSGGGYDFSSMGSSSNWTIDMWIYTKSGASGSGFQTLVNGSGFGDGPNNIWFGVDNDVPLSGTLRAGNSGSNELVGPQMPGTEAWHHVGLMRKDDTLYFLLNGETTAAPDNPTLGFGPGLEFLGGSRNNPFGLGYASRIRVAPAAALFAVGTYTLPVEADYDPAGGITVTVPASTVNALDYNSLANKPTIPPSPNQELDTGSNVTFNKVDTVAGISTRFIGDDSSANQGNVYPTNGTYLDLTSSQADINSDSIQFWSGNHSAHRATIDSSGFKIEAGNLIFPDNTTQSTAATGGSNPYGTTSTKLTVAGIDIEGLNTATLKFSYSEAIAATDTFAANVEVLARGAALDDASTNNYTITASGSAVAGSTGETNLEAGSFYSPGTTSDYITIDSSPSLVYGTGNFTIDFWLYTAENETSGVKTMAADWTGGKWIIQGGNGNNEYYALLQGSGGDGQQFVYFDITPNQWNHIAIVRESDDTFKVYVDGVLDDTNTGISGKDLGDSGDITLFLNGDGNQQPFPGYIEDFRITTAARYTENFTPPAAASEYDLGSSIVNTASIKINSIEFADDTVQTTAYTGGGVGYTGSTGAQGVPGDQGVQGDQGPIGYTGSTGAQGEIGYTGSAGAQGDQGPIGYTGSAGANGEQGPIGYTGSTGASGNPFTGGTFTDTVTFKGLKETVVAMGNTTGTPTIDANSGTVFTMTLTGNVTISDLTNATTGTNATLILTQDGTGSRTLTSTMKFAGGSKTLSTAASSIDVIHVFYDGTNYLASLIKGYA